MPTQSLEVSTRDGTRELTLLGSKQPLAAYLRSIWARRELAREIAAGELRAENQDTVFGALWHLLNPLLLTAVYYLMFGIIFEGARGNVENFVAFLTIGIFVFRYTQKSTQSGAKSLVTNEGLIRSIQFPRAVLPLSTVLQETMALVPATAVMLFIALVTRETPGWTWLLLVPMFALQGVFNLGAAMFMARVTDIFTDTKNLLPFVFRLLFYMSGILYDVERFANSTDHPILWQLFHANPIYVFISIARDSIMSHEVDPLNWALAAGYALLVFLVGFLFFRGGEARYGRG